MLVELRLINDAQLQLTPDFNSRAHKPYRVEGKIGIFHYRIENLSKQLRPEEVAARLRKEARVSFSFVVSPYKCHLVAKLPIPGTLLKSEKQRERSELMPFFRWESYPACERNWVRISMCRRTES